MTLQVFEWGVIAFGIGIALYFSLPAEPPWPFTVFISMGLVIAALCVRRFWDVTPMLWTCLVVWVFIIVGVGRAAWHSQSVATYFLPETRAAYTITGWIEAVEKSGSRYRWRVRVKEMQRRGRDVEFAPLKVRFKADVTEFKVGDSIRIKALLTPPPSPVIPGGYDPARRAYFEKVGGYGFAISKADATPLPKLSHYEALERRIAMFRYRLADRIRARAPPETAGLQAALLTGVRTYIPPEHTESLRIAGLAHILAISGLHMGLLAGSGYALAAFLLAMIAPLSRRYDVRKFAALFGAIIATGYLVLSGAGVSTQRAYIMAMIVFLALWLDRRALSIRSVALAAAITLWLHPESLMSAGFHMSFSASAALVVFYNYWRGLGFERYRPGIIAAITRNMTGITLTSLVAGTVTSAYAVLHFNRLASYGFVGNIFAMPIFTFIVMPAAFLSLCLLPWGLETLPLAIMGWGIELILYVSRWIQSWTGAQLYVAATPVWVVAIFSLGFIFLCLGRRVLVMAGTVLISLCFLFWHSAAQPQMRISESGQVAFWDADHTQLYVTSLRSDKYGREQFLRRAGFEDVPLQAFRDHYAVCDTCGLSV